MFDKKKKRSTSLVRELRDELHDAEWPESVSVNGDFEKNFEAAAKVSAQLNGEGALSGINSTKFSSQAQWLMWFSGIEKLNKTKLEREVGDHYKAWTNIDKKIRNQAC